MIFEKKALLEEREKKKNLEQYSSTCLLPRFITTTNRLLFKYAVECL